MEARNTHDEKPVTLRVRFSREGMMKITSVEICLSSTVKDLKDLLQPITNVPPSAQRLINDGRMFTDERALVEYELTDGAMRFLLAASEIPHQGDDQILMEPPITTYSRILLESTMSKTMEEWKATGIISLSLFELIVIPDVVWTCASFARIFDISHNSVKEVPYKIGSFIELQELNLSANGFQDDSICWGAIAKLKSLTNLNLVHNQLTSLPSEICALASLRQLDISRNNLKSVPDEIGQLKCLEIFRASNNRIGSVSPCIGTCTSLVEVKLALNRLNELPTTFEELKNLKVLSLNSNVLLKTLPRTLLKSCRQLVELDLQYTRYEGWEEFDERRAKAPTLKQKMEQIDSHGTSSPKNDEGADNN